jgi:hypothetical protein
MKKLTLLFSALALVTGVGSAIAVNVKPASQEIMYDWIDWDDQIILQDATQSEAQEMCVPTIGVCLRAKNYVFIHTTGSLPW